MSRNAITRLVNQGWLTRVHQGVYIVGALESQLTRPAAALLACGPNAALSHRSAAVVWGLLPHRADAPIQVTLLNAKRRSRDGVEIHYARRLETRWRDGLKVTSPVRTLEDLRTREFDRALNEAQVLRLLTHRAVRESRRVRRALEDDLGMTRSEAERRLLALIKRAGLPLPETNVRVHGHEVDLYWRSQNFAVEFDGWAYHSACDGEALESRLARALSTVGSRPMPLVN